MTVSLPFAAAFQVGRPLFGNQWLALLAAVGCIALLLVAVALLGRWLAATHPAPAAKAAPTSVEPASTVITTASAISSAPVITGEVPPEIVPVILAAMTAYIGARVRVVTIQRVSAPVPAVPSLEALMQQWSYEGRRQIYSSHKVR